MRKLTGFLLLLAFVAGICAPLQFGVNSALRGIVGGPALAAMISFFIGTVALIIAALVMRESLPEIGTVSTLR